jgi:hypothetical protein
VEDDDRFDALIVPADALPVFLQVVGQANAWCRPDKAAEMREVLRRGQERAE